MVNIKLYLIRFFYIFIVCAIFSWIISELSFRLQGNTLDRGPEIIELEIPKGTAENIAKGIYSLSIPEEMTFVVGDKLVVINNDTEAHELGPLLIPPGSRSSLTMGQEDSFLMGCSFSATNYLGLTIREPTTWKTRLLAISFAAPPTAIIAFMYSLAIKPISTTEKEHEI